MNYFQDVIGIDPFSKEFGEGLSWILKNWDHEKESYSEFYDRVFGKHNQPERLNEEARKGCDSPNTPTKGSESSRND